jgi:AraC-like DNA-binding protein
MTNQHLRRKIFSITGITGAVYILGIRMAYAQQLLVGKRKYPIATVALKCGYEDSNNFSRTFKRVVGMTPSEYAKSVDNVA